MKSKNLFLSILLIVSSYSIVFYSCDKEENIRKETYDNGYYEGEFNAAGKRHGQGTYYYNDGTIYVGQWENGNRKGEGTFTYKDGTTFTCEWKDDKPNNDKCYLIWTAKAWYYWNYFSIAKNCSKHLSNFGYIMEYSMYKTFAAKYRTKVKRICRKYKHNDIFTIKYKVKSGNEKSAYFYNGGFKRKSPFKNMSIDNQPNTLIYASSTSLIDRLKAEKCELCGATERLIMHHVRKLKDLKGGL